MPSLMICLMISDHAMNLLLGRAIVSHRRSKFQPKIVFRSSKAPSARSLLSATILSRGIGSNMSRGREAVWMASSAARSILRMLSASGRSTVIPIVSNDIKGVTIKPLLLMFSAGSVLDAADNDNNEGFNSGQQWCQISRQIESDSNDDGM